VWRLRLGQITYQFNPEGFDTMSEQNQFLLYTAADGAV